MDPGAVVRVTVVDGRATGRHRLGAGWKSIYYVGVRMEGSRDGDSLEDDDDKTHFSSTKATHTTTNY